MIDCPGCRCIQLALCMFGDKATKISVGDYEILLGMWALDENPFAVPERLILQGLTGGGQQWDYIK
jgi:hypothetical protein